MAPHIEGKETPIIETTNDARQGRLGSPVVIVLIVSLILAVGAGFVLGFIRI